MIRLFFSFTSVTFCLLLASNSLAQATVSSPLRPCTVQGSARPAQCGEIAVPEDRSRPGGRTIALNVTVLKAPAPQPADALLFFAGGPGQGGATLAAQVTRELEAAAPDRDIIFIDQRGTGRSRPLTCDGGFSIVEPNHTDALVKCRESLAAIADLNDYGSDESADDAADVVRALGYAQVTVVGVSYGTRLASTFVARHSALVRSVVLRAMAPPGFNILRDGGRNARAGLNRLFADCASDATCRGAFPNIESEFTMLRQQLRRGGGPLTSDQFDAAIYALLLTTPTRQIVPWLVHNAAIGNVIPLLAVVQQVEAVYATVAIGAYLSVVCSEDAPRLTAEERREMDSDFSAGTDTVAAACGRWSVAPETNGPPAPRLPTLVVSGDLDPAMPPSFLERALAAMPNARHIVLPATSHGPTFPGCSADLVRAFIQSSGQASPDSGCLSQLTLPPFRTQ